MVEQATAPSPTGSSPAQTNPQTQQQQDEKLGLKEKRKPTSYTVLAQHDTMDVDQYVSLGAYDAIRPELAKEAALNKPNNALWLSRVEESPGSVKLAAVANFHPKPVDVEPPKQPKFRF